ncbi:hypothetical protein EON83_15390 [bacterium]|nr:MAG: hypothetical protein EON83_15390 [bacterium]
MQTRFNLIAFGLCASSSLQCALAQPASNISWQPMPLVSPQALRMPGVTIGGEGGQWPRAAPAIAATDPNFLLLPIDVGGFYRSLDGGQTWRLSTRGWNARGANGFAIDPKNANRVIGIGGNGDNWNPTWGQSPNGMYLSTDKGASWTQTLAVPDGKAGRVEFDPTSFDKAKGYCMVAYYSSPLRGLFRSDDGGATWKGLNRIAALEAVDDYNAARIALNPANGTLYLAGKNGFYRSSDKGQTFLKTADMGNIYGLNVIPSQPNTVWISNIDGLFISQDSGKSFRALGAKGISRDKDAAIRDITVSPANAKEMLVWVQNANWRWLRYISHDGGENFTPIRLETGLQSRADIGEVQGTVQSNALIQGGPAFLPFNTRNGYFTWHPTNANIVWGIGGDWVTKSRDGGKTFQWSNNGFNGIMLGQSFNFSATQPNTVFLGFQDNNGAFSNDNGKMWNYRDVSGKGWGGHDYGAGQSGEVMWCGDAEDWGGVRRTRISRDGGQTWAFAKDANGQECRWSGTNISYTSPKDANILFASNWRSNDKGATWTVMADCDGVYTHAAKGELFGRKGNALVQSKDGGVTWQKLTDVEGGFEDVAFDGGRQRWYFASQGQLKSWEKGTWKTLPIPTDQYGNRHCITVAVDPGKSDIVYGGGPANIYATQATVYRSCDAGESFENISTGDGPHEVQWIRVHPLSGDVWLNGQCYGMWRIARPTQLGAAPANQGDMPRVAKVPDGETPLPAAPDGRPHIAKIIRDLGPQGLEYTYGPQWKNGDNVKGTEDSLRLDTTEWGGGGLVLNGANLTPFGETHLALRARPLPNNGAKTLAINIIREGQETRQVSFDLSKLAENRWTLLLAPLGDGDFSNVAQIQLQGTNFGEGAARLRVDIDAIGTAKLAPGAPLIVDEGEAPALKMAPTYAPLKTSYDPNITRIIRDFGPAGAEYTYGPDWKNGDNVKCVEGAVQFDTTTSGGAGIVVNGMDLALAGQTHLALRARVLPGNVAKQLAVNLMREDADGGKATVLFDLSKLREGEWVTLREPLGTGKWNKVNQIQFQGTDWSPNASALKIEIDEIGTTSIDEEANAKAREILANDPTAGPPTQAKPNIVGWGFYPQYPQAWMNTHNGFLERTEQGRKKDDIGVIFLGDSITQGWTNTGKAVWDAKYAPLKAVDYGIGGDSTRQVLWRLEHGEVDGLAPKVVVLKIGTNNLYGDQNSGSDEEIAAAIAQIVRTLRQKLPNSQILLLGLLPRQNDYFSGRIKTINSLIAPLDDGKKIRFLDMGTKFRGHEGKGDVFEELYNSDHLHLSAKGYEMWANTMAPLFDSLMK